METTISDSEARTITDRLNITPDELMKMSMVEMDAFIKSVPRADPDGSLSPDEIELFRPLNKIRNRNVSYVSGGGYINGRSYMNSPELRVSDREDIEVVFEYTDERVARIKAIEADLIQARLKVETAKADLAATLTDNDIEQAKNRLRSDFYWFDQLDMQHQQLMLRKYVDRIELRNDDPLGIEPGLVFKFRVPVFDEPEPARAPKPTKHHKEDNQPIRVVKSAVSIGRAESLDAVIQRLKVDSRLEISSTSACTNSACSAHKRKPSVSSRNSRPDASSPGKPPPLRKPEPKP